MRTCEVEIRDGVALCPFVRAGRIDVETCYRCRRLRAFDDSDAGTRAFCAVPARVILRERLGSLRRRGRPG